MARFKIISKDGSSVKYEGKLRYIGSYLKPSYVEFSEISSPTPINWEIGDYVDYSRTGMRYRLFSVPQVVKNAREGSHGNAFSYTNVQFFAATKELEIALFRDLVLGDNNMHFSTSPDVATFEDVAGIARRIQACMDDLYPGRWEIRVADFDAEADAVVIEKITTAKDFALSGGTCLDALSKIYELWQDIGWIHSYDPTREKDIITIGYANKRIDANTTDAFLYGKGNGLTAIKKSQANKDEFATRLYVYGSERNLPARYYNDKDILNAESVDIRNLMLPMDVWGRTDGKPDARKAYIENAEAVAKIGVIPRVHYFDSEEAGADIYPSIEGMTVGMLRKVLSDMGDTAYSPSYGVYTDASERVDEVGGVISLPADEGKISEITQLTTIAIPSYSKEKNTGIVDTIDLIENHILYEGLIESSFEMGEITVRPSVECTVTNADFSSVIATLTLDDSLGASTSSPSKTISIPAEYDESRNLWVLPLKDISVKYDKKSSANGFYIYLYISISATKNNPGVGSDAIASVLGGKADIEVKQILSKTFNLRLKQLGFNLNLQGDLGKGKTISLKTGKCAGRNFIISSAKYNPGVDSWDITCKRQQDETLGLLFPNTNYEIQTGDRFVLLDIVMPESYIRVAMERLLTEGQRLFNQVSTVRSNYEPSIDAKLMAESGRHLREGMFMEISDSDIVDNTTEHILIDTLSIYEDESAIPTYKVTLRERRKVTYKGTPSAAATTKTSSVEDGETDMSEYAKTAYVDKKDKEFSSTLSKILDWFTLTDGVLLTKYNLASEKEVSAKGINASQGGGTSYNRLDSWSAYDSSKAGYVLSALLGYDLHSRVTNLENAEVDLSDYYTKSQADSQIASAIGAIDLSPYATKEALSTLQGQHDTLRSEFDALNNLLSSDTEDYINTWNEVVAFLDGYKDESDLATILSGMNGDIASRLLASDFESWKTTVFTPTANLVANHTTKLDRLDQSILSINTRLEGVDKTIEDHIAEFIAFRANFEITDNLILVRKNFASTEEVSAKGINQGTGGGGGSSYSRLDTWEGYDNNKAGYVLSAGLGYGLKVAIDELNGYDLDNRVRSIENSYVSKDAGGVINGGLTVSRLAIAGGSSSQFLKADGSLDSTSYLPTSGGVITGDPAYLTLRANRSGVDSWLQFTDAETSDIYAIGLRRPADIYGLQYRINTDYYDILHSGNIGDYALKTDGSNIMNEGIKWTLDSTPSSWDSYFDVGGNRGLRILNNVGHSTEGAPSNYAVALAVSGYYGFALAYDANGSIFKAKGFDSTDWKTIAFAEDVLSTSGGTINKADNAPLFIEGNVGGSWVGIGFKNDNGIQGFIGANNDTPVFVNSALSASYTLLHSGNVGDYAAQWINYGGDSLAYYHGVRFFTKYESMDCCDLIMPTWAGNTASDYYAAILRFRINGEIEVRNIHNGSDNAYQGWRSIAFTDSDITGNAATATKLNDNTAYTIWGNTFFENGKPNNVTSPAIMRYLLFSDSDGGESGFIGRGGDDDTLFFRSYKNAPIYIGRSHYIDLVIKDSNVLIGTDQDRGAKLYVNGTFRCNALRTNSTAVTYWGVSDEGILSWDTTYASVMAKSGLALRLGIDGTPYITIASNGAISMAGAVTMGSTLSVGGNTTIGGNVGIGTPSPSYKLDVIGDIRATESITIGGATLSWENGALKVNTSFYSEKEISAKGLSTGGGSGASYNRLDAWGDYDSSKAGYVLSAYLGDDLNTRLSSLSGVVDTHTSRLSSLESAGYITSSALSGYLPTSGGTIGGSLTVDSSSLSPLLINTSHSSGIGLRLAQNHTLKAEFNWDIYAGTYMYNHPSSSYIGIKDDGTPNYNGKTLIHSGNYSSYALSIDGGTIYGSLTINSQLFIGGDNLYDGAKTLIFRNASASADYGTQIVNSSTSSSTRFILTKDGVFFRDAAGTDNTLLHTGNIGSQSVAYASNAGTVGGYGIPANDNKPWGALAYITPSGWMEIGKHIEFHFDNTTGSDYSSVLACSGNHGNWVNLPSASGTLALLTDNVASATKLATSRTIWGQSFDGTQDLSGDLHLYDSDIYWYRDKANYCIETVTHDEYSPSLKIAHYGGIDFHAGGVSRMYIDYLGNVGIGTTNPKSKLDVEGDIVATSFSSNSQDTFVENEVTRPWYGLSVKEGYYKGVWLTGYTSIHLKTSNTLLTLNQSGFSVDCASYLGGATTVADTLTVIGDLTVNSILTVGGASIHPTANNPYFQLYQNNKYWYWQADDNYTYIGGTMKKALQIDQEGNTLIRGSLGVTGDATMDNATINAVATAKRLVVGTDGMSCNAPATFNDFIYSSSITPKTDNYYVLGNNNYKWYAVTAYNVNVHDAITIEAGKELRFKDDSGVVHTLKYDSTKQAFVFDGNVNATGEVSAKRLNA